MAASLRRFAQSPPGSGLTRMGCMIDRFYALYAYTGDSQRINAIPESLSEIGCRPIRHALAMPRIARLVISGILSKKLRFSQELKFNICIIEIATVCT